MKKVLSYILIFVVVFVNLFAPFSVGFDKKIVQINKNEARAEDCKFVSVSFSPATTINDTRPEQVTLNISTSGCVGNRISGSITQGSALVFSDVLKFNPQVTTSDNFSMVIKTGENFCDEKICETKLNLMISDPNTGRKITTYESNTNNDSLSFKCTGVNNVCDNTKTWDIISLNSIKLNSNISYSAVPSVTSDSITIKGSVTTLTTFPAGSTLTASLFNSDGSPVENGIQVIDINGRASYSVTFSNLLPSTSYDFTLTPSADTNLQKVSLNKITTLNEQGQTVVPLPKAVQGNNPVHPQESGSDMPACSLTGGLLGEGTFTGCIAQAFYYVLFIPTSYLFALSGVFFDSTFAYSVQDSSYRSTFVVEGWGLIRDFCNMFFIFILLYTAIATILNLHGFNTKETIVRVIIIGLFINFSLFATQVIIDASNITARVFYNSDAIKITENGANGVANATPGLKVGEGGIIPLSAALVNKVNPQNIIINSKKVNDIPIKGSESSVNGQDETDMGAGTFILIVIIATAVNLVGIVVFASVGLIFISRVIGLWLSMIFAPLAFFTYILPQMQGTKMVGWKNWWPETLKMAFLAPVFMFFLYIILKFLELDLISDPMSKDGLTFFVATLMPFAFIMILMMKAKSIATDMSGEIGQQITSKVAMVGGLALGAATGGAAFLGRTTVGRLANKLNNSNALNDAAAGKNGKFVQTFAKFGKRATDYTAKSSFDVRQSAAGNAFSKETGMNLNTGTKYLGLDTKKGLGGYVGVQQRKLEEEKKFGEMLGSDHHKVVAMEDAIAERKGEIAKAEKEQELAKAEFDGSKGKIGHAEAMRLSQLADIEANNAQNKAREEEERLNATRLESQKAQQDLEEKEKIFKASEGKRVGGDPAALIAFEEAQKKVSEVKNQEVEADKAFVEAQKKATEAIERQASAAKVLSENGVGTLSEKEAQENYRLAQRKTTAMKSGGDYINEKGEIVTKTGSLNDLEKNLERQKSARSMEYALTRKRKSGKIFDIDKADKRLEEAKRADAAGSTEATKQAIKEAQEEVNKYRDANNNIKKFGHGHEVKGQGTKVMAGEALKGALKGGATGALIGSAVPVIGTAVGFGVGTLSGAIKAALAHDGNTNAKVGDAEHGHKETATDKYKEPSGGGGSHKSSGGGGDHGSHGGDKSHGGGDDHKPAH